MDTPTPSMRSLALKCAVETCLPDGLPASTDAGSSHDHEITRRRHAESSNRALRPCESVSWKQSKVALLTFSKSVWTLAYLLLKAVASIVSWVHISLVQYLRDQDAVRAVLLQPLPSSVPTFSASQLEHATSQWSLALKCPAHEAFGLIAWSAPSLQAVVQLVPVNSVADAHAFRAAVQVYTVLHAHPHPAILQYKGCCSASTVAAHAWHWPDEQHPASHTNTAHTLRSALRQGGSGLLGSVEERLSAMQQMTSAVQHLLAKGLVVRALSTETLIISQNPRTQCTLAPLAVITHLSHANTHATGSSSQQAVPVHSTDQAGPSTYTQGTEQAACIHTLALSLGTCLLEVLTGQPLAPSQTEKEVQRIADACGSASAHTLMDDCAVPLLSHALAGPVFAALLPLLAQSPAVCGELEALTAHLRSSLQPAVIGLQGQLQQLHSTPSRWTSVAGTGAAAAGMSAGSTAAEHSFSSPSAPPWPGHSDMTHDPEGPSAPPLPSARAHSTPSARAHSTPSAPAFGQHHQAWEPTTGHRAFSTTAAAAALTGAAAAPAAARVALREAPRDFICPITADVMHDPVVAADGHTYERHAISAWLARKHVSPMTNLPMANTELRPNHTVRSMIAGWHEYGT